MQRPQGAESCSWRVQMAQFVPRPAPQFQARAKSRKVQGSWIASKSMATVTVSRVPATLVLVLDGNVYEEHYITQLSFAWPRTSNGCKVIVASYEVAGNKHKFAMKFMHDIEATMCFRMLQDAASSDNGHPEFYAGFLEAGQKDVAEPPTSLPSSDGDLVTPVDSSLIKEVEPLAENVQDMASDTALNFNLPAGSSAKHKPDLREEIMACLLDPSFPSFVKEVAQIWQELEENALRLLVC